MGYKKVKLCSLYVSVCLSIASAQEGVTASGGDGAGSGGSVAYSIGQIAYTTNQETTGSVSQGVQQAYEIFIVDVEERNLNIAAFVFPNPTTNDLILQVQNPNHENLKYQLFNPEGKLIISDQIIDFQEEIKLKNFSSGIYFLNILQGNYQIKCFKIIKN